MATGKTTTPFGLQKPLLDYPAFWFLVAIGIICFGSLLVSKIKSGSPAAISASSSATAALPTTGKPGQVFTLNGVSYTWEVNGQGGYTGATGWKHNVI